MNAKLTEPLAHWCLWLIGQLHNTEQAVTFGMCRVYSAKPMSMSRANTNHRDVYGSYSRPTNNNLNPDFQLGGER
jgi:hypothetical protein